MADEGQAGSPTSKGATSVYQEHAARDRGNGTVVSSTECSKLERSRFAMTMLTGPRRVSQTIYVMIRVVCY